jgi:hypothetical protein
VNPQAARRQATTAPRKAKLQVARRNRRTGEKFFGSPELTDVQAFSSRDGGRREMNVPELREHAAECVRMAQNCSTDRERLAFLELAQTWLDLAERQERVTVSLAGRRRSHDVKQKTEDRPN